LLEQTLCELGVSVVNSSSQESQKNQKIKKRRSVKKTA
jgi:hypothetical protein